MNNLYVSYIICLLISQFVLINRSKIATYLNLFDEPDNFRKIHKNSTPMVGGIYIYLSFILFFSIYIISEDFYQIRFILSLLI